MHPPQGMPQPAPVAAGHMAQQQHNSSPNARRAAQSAPVTTPKQSTQHTAPSQLTRARSPAQRLEALTGPSPRQQLSAPRQQLSSPGPSPRAAAPQASAGVVEASGATIKLQSAHTEATSFERAFSELRGCNSIVLFNTRDDPCCQMMHTLLTNVIGDGHLSEVEVGTPFHMLKQPLADGLQAEFPAWLLSQLKRSTGCGAPFVYVNNNFYGDYDKLLRDCHSGEFEQLLAAEQISTQPNHNQFQGLALSCALLVAVMNQSDEAVKILLDGGATKDPIQHLLPKIQDREMLQLLNGRALPSTVVINGPSGVGKGTLIGQLRADYPDLFGFVVSHTTRAPRPGEQDGVHYHFSDHATMESMIANNQFVEHANVHGNIYGTSKAALQSLADDGTMGILDIDVQGAQAVKRAGIVNIVYVFVNPPSIEALEGRLRGRGTETEDKIRTRLANARAEMNFASTQGFYDKVVVNDDLDACYQQLCVWLGLKFQPPAAVERKPDTTHLLEQKSPVGALSVLPQQQSEPLAQQLQSDATSSIHNLFDIVSQQHNKIEQLEATVEELRQANREQQKTIELLNSYIKR